MPELPEVETVCRGLAQKALGDTLVRVELRRKNLRFPLPRALSVIKNQRVTEITRRAKYILLSLSSGEKIVIHLGMSGRLMFNPDTAGKHDHVVFHFKSSGAVVFNDARRFGLVDVTRDPARHRLIRNLGPEPLETGFDAEYLSQKLRHKKTAVKTAIMDQRLVVGVGNIYASEALWRAGIDPRKIAAKITEKESLLLVKAIKATLSDAIKAGGSSLKDYVQTDGELGYFQHSFAVYDRAGKPCRKCRKSAIEKTVQGGRSTFYCPQCQK
jgi:formamidopyrimidine-DNA glycosylase